jgi:phosphopantetheinyl transferase
VITISSVFSSGRNEKDKYDIFYLIWSLKEAFIKAIGLGLGYDLSKVNWNTSLLLSLIALLDFSWTLHFHRSLNQTEN